MLTVMFATYNGAHTLPRMLGSLATIETPRGGWKIVAIDNGSTDASAAIIDGFRGRLPLARLSQPKRGKNVALNHGLASIEGDLVVLTDDDVIPGAAWLTGLRAAADEHDEATAFGGPILLEWESAPPVWIERGIPLPEAYGLNPRRPADGPSSVTKFWGANLAIRAHVFAEGLRFDETIGPRPGDYRMGGESELLRRLEAQGATGWFVNHAEVRHLVRAHQLELAWLRGRAFRKGRASCHARARRRDRWPPATVAGQPFPLLWDLAKAWTHLLAARLRGDITRVFAGSWNVWHLKGIISEFHSWRRTSDPP